MGIFWFMTLQPQLILLYTAWTILCFPSRACNLEVNLRVPLYTSFSITLNIQSITKFHQYYLLKMFLEFMFLSYLHQHHLIQATTTHLDHTLCSWSTHICPLFWSILHSKAAVLLSAHSLLCIIGRMKTMTWYGPVQPGPYPPVQSGFLPSSSSVCTLATLAFQPPIPAMLILILSCFHRMLHL